MARANLAGSDLRETTFVRARAQNASFFGARLDHADLSHANVTGADLRAASLVHANLHALRDEDALYADAKLTGARRTDLDRLEAEVWLPPASA
jgi:uncharacterized protein YjbI with pentapeptide repeats